MAKKLIVSEKTVDKISELACLEITSQEKELYLNQLNSILNYVSQLQDINTDEVEPTFHVLTEESRFREDEIDERVLSVEDVLMNADEKEKNYIKMPKIL